MGCRLGARVTKRMQNAMQRVTTQMTKPGMPKLGVRSREESLMGARACSGGPGVEGIQFTGGVTSEQSHPGAQILDREAPWIKFNRNQVITS